MTKSLIKIYNDEGILYQVFDKDFEDENEAHEYCRNYCLKLNNLSNDLVSYKYVISNDAKELEYCEFFEKCLKTAVQMALNNSELAKQVYIDNMTPESVSEALDEEYYDDDIDEPLDEELYYNRGSKNE